MLAKKTSLRIFIISVIITSLFANAVTAQNITQDHHEKYQVTFDFEVVDAFTKRPLNGGLRIYAVCNDTLWQEELEWGEWKQLGTYEFKNGKLRVRLPLHGLYGFEVWVDEGEGSSPYGALPFYESVWKTYRFDGNLTVRIRLELYPVGYVIVKLYDPSGRKLVFKSEGELIRFNGGQLYGSHDYQHFISYHYFEDSGMLAIRVPANRPSKIYWMAYIRGYGFAWLEADNNGEGYLIDEGRYITINLVYDSAVTMLNKVKAFISKLRSQNVLLSANVTELLENAESLLSSAEKRGDSEMAVSGWRALQDIFKAWEQAILDYSWHRIDKYRMGVLTIDLPEGFHARISLDYVDFILGPGWFPEKAGPYWQELQKFSKTGLQWAITPYYAMRKDGSVPEEAVLEQVRDFRERLGFKRLFAEIHDFKYPSPADTYGSDIPEQILRNLRIYNLTKTVEMSKNLARSLILAAKKHNISFEGYMVAVEYDQAFLCDYRWRMFNGIEYLSPPRMKEKLTWLREIVRYVKELEPNAKIYTYLSGEIPNPFTISAHEEWIGYQMYSNTHLVEGAKYLIEHGIPIDVVGFQIHLLGSLVDPLNPIDVYHLMNNLKESLPSDTKFYAVEFTLSSRPTPDFSEFEGANYINENYQADFFRKAIIILLGFSEFEGIDFTSPIDFPDKAEGYVEEDGTPKPAFFAIKELFDSLIYEGEYPGAPVKTLAGWYNVTLYREGGRPIETYRIHIDGGSTTRLIVRFFENETLKVEVERLRSELEAYKSEIEELQKKVNSLQQQLAEKDETIHRLKKEPSKHRGTITVTITKTLKTTETVVSPSKDTLTPLLIALVAGLTVVTITVAIIALRRRANYVRR